MSHTDKQVGVALGTMNTVAERWLAASEMSGAYISVDPSVGLISVIVERRKLSENSKNP